MKLGQFKQGFQQPLKRSSACQTIRQTKID